MTAVYRFGLFELQPDERRLLMGGQSATLGPRAFDVLLALVERAGQLVSKKELLELVWPGLVVEENNLQVQISTLRKLVGPQAIATVPGRGYRWALALDDASAQAVRSEPATRAAPAGSAVVLPDVPARRSGTPLDARPINLPAHMTRFIGREKEIRAIKEHLSAANVRLLTLSGVGGTGKTRLALQAAVDLAGEFEQGVFFVPLAALSDPALVLPAIAKVFAVREIAGRPLRECLLDHLRTKQMLLVLDNFEQVIDAAPLVSELLTAAPQLKVLATSRELLHLSGETDFPVPPLSVPDPNRLPPLPQFTQYEGVALFVERAAAMKPGFTVTSENAHAVAQICHRLDGLPLAIELAAARARVLPPQRMLAELTHRLRFLTGGARDLPIRQKTLRSAIDWSHDLLTGEEQRLFRRLAVFVGGCALEAIAFIGNIENDLPALDTLESLIGKSLVRQTDAHGEPRFAMLETIREYAGDQLRAAGEEERLRERHRDYFLALAENAEPKLAGPAQAEWLRRLEAEHENLRAGLEWSLVAKGSVGGLRLCGALQRFWTMRGHFSEGRTWCERILGKAGADESTQERARVLNAAGELARFQGEYPASRACQEESLAIWRQLGERKGVATTLNNLGRVAWKQGDYASARAMNEESLAIMRELADRDGIASSLGNLGLLAHDQDDYPTSRSLLEEGLAIGRELRDWLYIATALNNLGSVATDQGDLASARALYDESLAIARDLGYPGGIARALHNLGSVANLQGDYRVARALYQEGLAITRQLEDRGTIAPVLEGLAEMIANLGSPADAARIWGSAARLREEIGSPVTPNDRPRYDRRVAAARAALGDDAAFDRAWHDGRALTLEQAIQLALEETASRTAASG
ncbi:MAG: tetratricopeptide repeat protein [Casimicrobiaceae bacterium]